MTIFSLQELQKICGHKLQGYLGKDDRIIGKLRFNGEDVLIMGVLKPVRFDPTKPGWAWYGTIKDGDTTKPCFYVSNQKRELVDFIQHEIKE
jgi:hypothetical protein